MKQQMINRKWDENLKYDYDSRIKAHESIGNENRLLAFWPLDWAFKTKLFLDH